LLKIALSHSVFEKIGCDKAVFPCLWQNFQIKLTV
jgi:hypothetical protein